VPLQFLSDTGVVGAALAFGAFGLLLAVALRRVRRSAGPPRMLEAALLAGAAAYLVHSVYDWDWDIPAVTLPALVFLGVLAGGGPMRRSLRASAAPRGLMLAALTLWLCVFASSSVLPSLAASKAAGAVVAAASDSAGAVQHAQASAELASQLDPLSDAGLKVQATVALRRGQVPQAIQYLFAAVKREPSDVEAWETLAFLEFEARDFPAAQHATLRALQLDPLGSSARVSARRTSAAINLIESPPRDSPTGRPLVLGGGR
jgi:tetratricopeptide (TPR) repeat protein